MRHLGTLAGAGAVLAVGVALLVVSGAVGDHGRGAPTTTPYAGRTAAPHPSPTAPPAPTVPLDPVTPGAADRSRPTERHAASPGVVSAGEGPVDTGLSRPARGRAAVTALGDALPAVAANAALSAAQLHGVLASDATAWVSPEGQVFYKEQVPTAPAPVAGFAQGTGPQQAPYPLDRTFALHSLPGSHHSLFLDFDGVTLSATNGWTLQSGVAPGTYTGWDPAGNGPAFTDDERAAIQGIWARVAEDYSAFDIDVTTQDPGSAALSMTDSSDVDFGTHVVMTDAVAPESAICGTGGCGGVAWTGVINSPTARWGAADRNQVAWVFPNSLYDMSSSIAEAAAHEAGHTFGLVHDGTSTTGDSYFTPNNGSGSKVWAPIMGASYYNAVSQWSKGDYPGATNWGSDSRGNPVRIALQDDVGLIRGIVGIRTTPASSIASPLAVDGATHYRTRSTDSDTFLLGACAAGATIRATGALVGPDLDLVLSVVDAAGRPAPGTSLANPPTTQSGVADPDSWARRYAVQTPTGLGSTVTVPDAGGPYFAVVRSGGNLGDSWASGGYDAYASLGAYALSQSGCSPAGGAVSDGGEVRPPITAPSSTAPAAPDVPPSATVPAPVAPRAPSAPRAAVRPGKAGGHRTVVISWTPGAAGSHPIASFQVTLYAVRSGHARVIRRLTLGPTRHSRELRLAAGGRRYAVTVLARSADGASAPSPRTRAVAPR